MIRWLASDMRSMRFSALRPMQNQITSAAEPHDAEGDASARWRTTRAKRSRLAEVAADQDVSLVGEAATRWRRALRDLAQMARRVRRSAGLAVAFVGERAVRSSLRRRAHRAAGCRRCRPGSGRCGSAIEIEVGARLARAPLTRAPEDVQAAALIGALGPCTSSSIGSQRLRASACRSDSDVM